MEFHIFILSSIIVFIAVISDVFLRLMCGKLVDDINNNHIITSKQYLLFIIVITILLLASALKSFLQNRYNAKIVQKLWSLLFKKSLYIKQSYLDNINNGQNITLYTSDINQISKYILRIIIRFIPDFFTFISAIIVLFYIHPLFAFISVAGAIIPLLVMKMISKKMNINYKKYQLILEKINKEISKGLYNIEMVKAYSLQNYNLEVHTSWIKKLQNQKKRISFIESIVSIPSLLSAFICMTIMSVLGGYMCINNYISLGEMLTSITLINYIVSPIMYLDGTISAARAAEASFERMNEYTNLPEEKYILVPQNNKNIMNIEFHDVSFSYDEENNVLQNFNMIFEKGKINYILGENGTGKSTLIKLICGIYIPQKGFINVLGTPTNEWNLKDLRDNISFSPQEIVIFSQSIKDNLVTGNNHINIDEIEYICDLVSIHKEIIKLPQKYLTYLGEGGKTLSRGQRQRLSLARALLKKNKIYIFDEPTSALDSKNSIPFIDALADLAKENIVIVITHNLDLINKDDIHYKLRGGIGERYTLVEEDF